MDRGITDARPTPAWARLPSLVGLGALAAYFLGCMYYAMDPGMPRWAAFGNWKMFTEIDKTHDAVLAEALYAEGWERLDLEALFPTWWDSGPRYARGPFRRSGSRMRILADSACERDPRAPRRVRLTTVSWRAHPGHAAGEPPAAAKRAVAVDWDCRQTAPRPAGARW